jgi:hypothetical protein
MRLGDSSSVFQRRDRLSSPASKRTSTSLLLRIRLFIPVEYQQEPVISQLVSRYGLVVNFTGAYLRPKTGEGGEFDLELRGTCEQIQAGLAYLRSLNLKIIGRPNPEGDSWLY